MEESWDEIVRRERRLLLLAAAFIWVNGFSLTLLKGDWGHLEAPAGWTILMLAAHQLLNRYRPGRDPFLLPLFGLLTGWGLILIDRLAANFLLRQEIWLLLATVCLLCLAILPHNLSTLRRYRYSWLIIGLALLIATLLFGVNPTGFGATLWLPLPILNQVYFQPSELLKLLLIVFLASYFDEREQLGQLAQGNGRLQRLIYLAPLLLMWSFCIILLVWQRDLGAATLFFITFLALLYLATGNSRYLIGGLSLLLMAGVLAYFAFDVVALRVDGWWNPWPEADNRAFQIVQSLYALAAGGIGGQGLGQGFPDYIPVIHSDFVFAAVAEEYGLIGSLSVVALFALLTYRGLRIAMRCRRPFDLYLAAGITILLATQALLIMAGVTRLLPLTGVTLPFISYGGSSLLMSSLMLGLLLFLSAEES